MADDSTAEIQSSYQLGDLFALDMQRAIQLRSCWQLHCTTGSTEFKTVAAASPLQGQGIGRQLLAAVLEDLRQRGTRRVVVGTSTSHLEWKKTAFPCGTWCGWIRISAAPL